MTPSRREKKRRLLDMRTGDAPVSLGAGGLRGLLDGRNVLNLRPKFVKRHPRITLSVVLGIVLLGFLGIRGFSTRATVQDFFPATCLGNWQGVANAEGAPATLGASGTPFSADNSAVYASGTEIYCGGFVPSAFATSGAITNIGLTLVWQIGDAPTSSPATFTAVATPSSTPPAQDASSSDDFAPTSSVGIPTPSSSVSEPAPVSVPPPAPAPDNAPAVTVPDTTGAGSDAVTPPPAPAQSPAPSGGSDAAGGTSFLRALVPFAFADDATGTPGVLPSLSDASGTATGTVPLVEAPAPVPDEHFLDVSYSTDGQTWISVGKVSVNNWQQFTVTLPVADWNDLQHLQVRVEGLPTTQDPVPPVYLDGMFVEVDYTLPSPLALFPTNATSTPTPGLPRTIQVDPNVSISIPAPASSTPDVPAPDITAIDKTADQVSVTVQYVGDFYQGNPLYLFVYPDGTTAPRNDADSAFTFAGAPTEGPFINAWELFPSAFDPSSRQAVFTVVQPSPPPGTGIATGDMRPGTYDVDVSYFDSQTWHLVSAQTFTWP